MSTATTSEPRGATRQLEQSVLDRAIEESLRKQSVKWTVADTHETLDLSITHVRRLFANPTKSGKMPSDRDCWLFLQLCKARGLNPYLGDAYLVGYDDGESAKFNLITAHQALLKRAEASGKKKGMESGVIVIDKASGEERERRGDFYLEGREELVGAWAKVYRSDWDHPQYERLALRIYNKGYSRWKADPGGMIVKCAEASAHRLAFPNETGGMYIREEMEHAKMSHDSRDQRNDAPKGVDDLLPAVDELLTRKPNGKQNPAQPTADPGPDPTPDPLVSDDKQRAADAQCQEYLDAIAALDDPKEIAAKVIAADGDPLLSDAQKAKVNEAGEKRSRRGGRSNGPRQKELA